MNTAKKIYFGLRLSVWVVILAVCFMAAREDAGSAMPMGSLIFWPAVMACLLDMLPLAFFFFWSGE